MRDVGRHGVRASQRFAKDILAEPVGGVCDVAVVRGAGPPRLFHGVGNGAVEESALRDNRLDAALGGRIVELERHVLRKLVPRDE